MMHTYRISREQRPFIEELSPVHNMSVEISPDILLKDKSKVVKKGPRN
jgi:hypothetical protein